jgi:uncharacterized protein RhaS with RHS repeats
MDPATGRFTQEDPIGLAGGMNLYGFASGDPVNFSDPFGLCPTCRNELSRYYNDEEQRFQRSLTTRDRIVLGGAVVVAAAAGMGVMAASASTLAGAAPIAAAAGRIANGDFERTFETAAGTVRVFGEAVTQGKTLTLNNFLVYPDNARRLQSGVAAMRAGFRGVADAARAAGYDQVIVNFNRTSGANAGKIGQQVIDLNR